MKLNNTPMKPIWSFIAFILLPINASLQGTLLTENQVVPIAVNFPKSLIDYLSKQNATSSVSVPMMLTLNLSNTTRTDSAGFGPQCRSLSLGNPILDGKTTKSSFSSDWPTYISSTEAAGPLRPRPRQLVLEKNALRPPPPLSSIEELYPLAKNPWRWSASPPLRIRLDDRDLYGEDFLRDSEIAFGFSGSTSDQHGGAGLKGEISTFSRKPSTLIVKIKSFLVGYKLLILC